MEIVTIEGKHGLEISNVVEEANQIKDFLNEYFGINNENQDEEEVVE